MWHFQNTRYRCGTFQYGRCIEKFASENTKTTTNNTNSWSTAACTSVASEKRTHTNTDAHIHIQRRTNNYGELEQQSERFGTRRAGIDYWKGLEMAIYGPQAVGLGSPCSTALHLACGGQTCTDRCAPPASMFCTMYVHRQRHAHRQTLTFMAHTYTHPCTYTYIFHAFAEQPHSWICVCSTTTSSSFSS